MTLWEDPLPPPTHSGPLFDWTQHALLFLGIYLLGAVMGGLAAWYFLTQVSVSFLLGEP